MVDKKIIDRNTVTENNPNDDEKILKNDTKPSLDGTTREDEGKKPANSNPKVPNPGQILINDCM